MRAWAASLQVRVALAVVAVLALALGAVGLYTRNLVVREAERYEERARTLQVRRVQSFLRHMGADPRSAEDLQRALERASLVMGRRLVLMDPMGRVVADSHPGHPLPADARWTPQRLLRVGRMPMRLLLLDLPTSQPEPPVSALARAVGRSLLWAGVGAGLLGTLLALLLSHWVLAPIRALTQGARRLAGGDLSFRVSPSGPPEVAELARTFNRMAQALEEAERQRRSLMADVAHELRTPLTNLQGYLEALQDGVLEPTPETLSTLRGQVLQLARLVEDLRLLARAEAGSLHLERVPTSPLEVLQRAVSAHRARASARGVSLELRAPEDLPPVPMDPQRIGQVLGNLLENALRHTPEGGRVVVAAERADGFLRVVVEDTGPGIPPEHLPHLFERFYRVDPSRSRETGGAGLGLAIARSLVNAHGGSIWAENRPEGGARFVFTLPGEG